MAERMYECLEYVTIDGDSKPIKGIKMKHEVVDGVLHFFVNYDCFVYRMEERQESMNGIVAGTNVKEGG